MSWFGGQKPASPAPVETKLTSPEYNTNRNVDEIVRGLINAINDEKQSVKDHIHASLRLIGLQEPLLVLSKGIAFLNSTSRSNTNHRVLVMNVLSRVLDEQEEHNKAFSLPEDLAKALVIMASVEIVADKSINSEWQNSACRLLISLSRLVPDVVAKQMLDRFPSNEPPHYFVVKTLADFAHKYPSLFLPHLKEVLTRALPILAVIKHDNLRWVFSAGLGRWAEAIVVAMKEKKAAIPKGEFAASFHTALKHVLTEWITSYELKVRLVAAEGIGYMAHIVETDHLTQLFPKLLPTLMQLMKKEAKTDQLPVTTGLQNLLYVTVREAPEILNEHLQTIMQTVHAFFVLSLKSEGTYTKADKNELELMKVFAVLGTKFTDQVVNFLLKIIAENKDVHAKIATLRTLRYCVAHLVSELSSYRSTIIAGVNLISNDEDYRVLHDMVLLTNEMAPHDYLSNAGGTTLVNVVVRAASLTDNEIEQYEAKTAKKPGAFTPATVRTDADNTLIKLTSNDLSNLMDSVLWPFLLESLTPEKNHHSFAILCQCISDLAKRKRQDDDFIIDFDKMVNLPKPNYIFARLLVMLSEPFGRNTPGVNILRALYCLSPNINPDLVEVWSKKLAEMKRYLDGKDANSDQYNQDQWENLLLNFLRESIAAVASDEWNVQLGDALIAQLQYYKNRRKMKKAALSLLGLLVQLTKYKEFVNRAVNEIFNGTDHASDEERLGCARGLGQASAVHTDVVLTRLASAAKPAPKKSGFSLFSSAPVEVPGPKATALLSYGYVSMLTPQELFTARVDVHIIGNMVPVINESKAQEVKENGLRAIDFIGKAVHPKNIPNFTLKARDDLIKVVLGIMNPAQVEKGINVNKLRSLGLEALTTLISLPPRISGPVQQSVLSGTLSIFSNEFTELKVEENLLSNINAMLSSLLLSDPSQGTLDDIIQALETYVASSKLIERKRASNTFVYILKDFARLLAEKKTIENEGLRTTGRIIGKLVARITEKVVDIRYTALDSLYLVLRIHQFLKSGSSELPETVQRLGPLRGSLNAVEPNEIYAISKELSAILCDVIDDAQLSSLVQTLLTCLADFDEDGAGGCCIALNGLVRVRGAELEKETPNLVKTIVECMTAQEKRTQIFNGLQHAVRGLARHFGVSSMTSLVSHKVPHTSQVIRAIQVLSTDKNLTSTFIDFLVDIMNNGQIFEERRGKTEALETIATHISCSTTAALHELLEMSEVGAIAKDNYAKILCTILLRVGSANTMTSEPPTKDVQTCLKNFLVCVEDEEVLEKLEKNGIIDKCAGAQYADGIQDVLAAICKAHPEQIKPMYEFVKPFSIRTFIGQRVAATSMISVLLNCVKNDRETVHDALNSLLSRCGTDEKVIVKTYALRGLANLTKHPKDIMQKYATPVIAALNSCLEDTDEGIILESMKSIKQIFAVADDEYVSLLLTTLCVRLKPAFEKSNPLLRESSILLYGTLSRFAKGSVGDALINNIHSNLPTIIVHLQDDNKEVVKACKEALRMLVPELGSKLLADLFKHESFDAEKSIDIDKFADDFAATWVKEFPERISDIVMLFVVFYKSAWDGCTTAAVLITGQIIAKISAEQRKRVNLKHTCLGLVSLLKSPSAIIREKSAKILGLLYEA